MQMRGLVLHRYNRRYYIQYHESGGEYQTLGVQLVSKIPTDPKAYQEWLEAMRAEYAAREAALEQHVYEVKLLSLPDYSVYEDLVNLPSEIPWIRGYFAERAYIIDLDREVFTVDFSMHWKLANIPLDDNRWLRAICDSIYASKQTISYGLCSDEHMADVSIKLPEPIHDATYPSRIVTPYMHLSGAYSAFMTHLAAQVFVTYQDRYTYFAREWSPDSFPFRELAFALISIVSGHVDLHSFLQQSCDPANCPDFVCDKPHFPKPCGSLYQIWTGSKGSMSIFGEPCHLPLYPPGAAPDKTMYWFGNVVVTLVLVPDGKAISEASDWGISQGRSSFQIVAMSLFDVVLAEVYRVTTESSADCNSEANPRDKYFVRMTKSIPLSPIRERYCTSTHPRERPEAKAGMQRKSERGLRLLKTTHCTGTPQNLKRFFPGLAALFNFFEVAAVRGCSYRQKKSLPVEIYDQILNLVGFRTWKACLTVSSEVRAACLGKYRLDKVHRLLRGPFVTREEKQQRLVLSYLFENMKTRHKYTGITVAPGGDGDDSISESNWMPIIGTGNRRALMIDVKVQFMPILNGQVILPIDDQFLVSRFGCQAYESDGGE
ncbi:hypothetical protein Cpir12675_002735 [Ceratocystis pirilliformis]|uniref:F-box domain-containing protein n=1 Tax=Ceratocystis pirilliformis TaxID=259994 RepID=A0ABR3Z8N1_9PEZI